jgi:hypothetical protein
MTVGYPDWGRSVQANTLPLIVVNQVVHGNVPSPLTYLGDIGYIDIVATTFNLADFYVVNLNWWDDANGLTFAGEDSFTCMPNAENAMQFKVRGRYLGLVIDNNQSTDLLPIVVYARGTNSGVLLQHGRQFNGPLIRIDQGINAGAGVTVAAPTIAPGPGVLSVHQGNNNLYEAELQSYLTNAGGWQRFLHVNGVTDGQSSIRSVILPAAPVRLVLTNTDTVLRTLWGALST